VLDSPGWPGGVVVPPAWRGVPPALRPLAQRDRSSSRTRSGTTPGLLCSTVRTGRAGWSCRRRPGTLRWRNDLSYDATGGPGHDTKRAAPHAWQCQTVRAPAGIVTPASSPTQPASRPPSHVATARQTRTRSETTPRRARQSLPAKPEVDTTPAASGIKPTVHIRRSRPARSQTAQSARTAQSWRGAVRISR